MKESIKDMFNQLFISRKSGDLDIKIVDVYKNEIQDNNRILIDISENDLEKLLVNSELYARLKSYGVDNWEWYYEAISSEDVEKDGGIVI